MQAFLIISVARQVDGEYCVIKTEKAFTRVTKAEEYFNGLSKKYSESIVTPQGIINCVCERAIFPIEIEEN